MSLSCSKKVYTIAHDVSYLTVKYVYPLILRPPNHVTLVTLKLLMIHIVIFTLRNALQVCVCVLYGFLHCYS